MNYNLLIFEDVSVIKNDTAIFSNLSLKLARGKIFAVLGHSGSGKTTFLRLILELLFAEKGWNLSGAIERFPGLRVAWVNQNPATQIFKNFVHEEFEASFAASSKHVALAWLAKMDAAYLLEKRCMDLSQGEKAIVAILSAISKQADLLALDEVMVNLSASKRKLLEQVLLEYKQAGGTIIMVEHTPEFIDYADEIIYFAAGKARVVDKEFAKNQFKKYITKSSNLIENIDESGGGTFAIHEIADRYIYRSKLDPISIFANKGEVVGIIGDNGSGKTTLLEVISGIRKIKHGEMIWNGEKIKTLKQRKKIMSLITHESLQLFFTATVLQELQMVESDLSVPLVAQIIKLFQLDKLFARSLNAMSYGERQRLALALGMISNPKMLILDEPTYGMDTSTCDAFVQAINLLTQQGCIVLLASHDVSLINQMATRIIKL